MRVGKGGDTCNSFEFCWTRSSYCGIMWTKKQCFQVTSNSEIQCDEGFAVVIWNNFWFECSLSWFFLHKKQKNRGSCTDACCFIWPAQFQVLEGIAIVIHQENCQHTFLQLVLHSGTLRKHLSPTFHKGLIIFRIVRKVQVEQLMADGLWFERWKSANWPLLKRSSMDDQGIDGFQTHHFWS